MDVNLWGTLADDPGGGARHDRARRRLDRDGQLDVDASHRGDLRRLRRVEGRARDGDQDARPSSSARTASGSTASTPATSGATRSSGTSATSARSGASPSRSVYAEVAGETALGYLPHSSEIAGSVLFFASDLAKPVTGQSLDVNCGHWFGAVIKLTVLVKRNPACRSTSSTTLARPRPHDRRRAGVRRYIRRYEQHHRAPADYRNGDTYDGVAIQHFDDIGDFVAFLQTPAYAAKVQPDEDTLLDMEQHRRAVHRGARGLHPVTSADVTVGADGVPRCWWCGDDPLYVDYHDPVGVPLHDERALFELLCLEGLSVRPVVDHDPPQAGHVPGGVRGLRSRRGRGLRRARRRAAARRRGHRAAPRQDRRPPSGNARAVGAMRAGGTSLVQEVWSHAPLPRPAALPSRADIPAETPTSATVAKVLRKWGMRFVGPTTVYAFMQSAGLVDDHLGGVPSGGRRQRSPSPSRSSSCPRRARSAAAANAGREPGGCLRHPR